MNDLDTPTAPVPAASALAPATLLQTTPALTPGYQTTEFWLHVLTILGVIGTSLSTAGLPAKWAAGFAVLSTASYGISRGLAKMGSSN